MENQTSISKNTTTTTSYLRRIKWRKDNSGFKILKLMYDDFSNNPYSINLIMESLGLPTRTIEDGIRRLKREKLIKLVAVAGYNRSEKYWRITSKGELFYEKNRDK